MINLKKSNYKKYIPLDIVALSYAEGGAMGCPGNVEIVTFDQNLYCFNYCYGDLDENDIYSICPELRVCSFGPFGHNKIPAGWKYYYLGAGNHLIINGRVCREFDRAKGEKIEDVGLYQTWLHILFQVLSKNHDSMRAMRVRVFEETVSLVNQGYYVDGKGKKIFFPTNNHCPIIESEYYAKEIRTLNVNASSQKTSILVENTDCLLAGYRLQKEGYNVAVLNMASRRTPGGGVISGAGAQEENLFRRSNLSQSMYQYAPYAHKYGVQPSRHQYPLDRDFGGVYTKDATVFRDTEDNGYALLSEPYQMAFISVPGMNRPDLTRDGMIAPHLVEPIKNKIRTIFRIGLENRHDALVLGALGCGAFRNPPKHIARLFHEVIKESEFANQYKVLLFAILEDHNSHHSHNPEGNFKPFEEEFSSNFNN